LALLDPDPFPNADPDPADQNECGSATLKNNRQLFEARSVLISSNTLTSKVLHILSDTEIEEKRKNQCSGFGFLSFWASQIRILQTSSKNSKKTRDFYCFVTFLSHFIFEK
jgi:hypothetical protein